MYLVIPIDELESAPQGANLVPDQVDFIKQFTGTNIPQKYWSKLNLNLDTFLLHKQEINSDGSRYLTN